MRQQVSVHRGITVIDDSYNASPDSMKAGLDVLKATETSGIRVAVLADMLELGEDAPVYHNEVGQYAKTCNIDKLVLYGELSEHIGKGFGTGDVTVFNTREEINEYLKKNLKEGDTVLFKGSRGMKLNECADYLKEEE